MQLDDVNSYLNPVIKMDEPNDSIELGSFEIELDAEGKIHKGLKSKWRYDFIPKPRLLCEAFTKEEFLGLKISFGSGCCNINLAGEAIQTLYIEGGNNKVVLLPRRNHINVTHKQGEETRHVIFHLFNFIDFMGAEHFIVKEEAVSKRLNAVTLEYNGWLVKITDIFDTDERIQKLRKTGGYVLTHVGKLEKKDGEEFSIKQGQEILLALSYLLSFSLGRWISPAFHFGYNSKNLKVWEEWGIGRTYSYSSRLSWLDAHNIGELCGLVPSFMKLWEDKIWRGTLSDSIHWYINANDGSTGIEKGIIATQIALEKVVWQYLVNHKKAISEKGFDDLRASDKIRLLCRYLEIPLQIPDQFSILKSKRNDEWWDLSWAITDVRNSLVHPKIKPNIDFKDAYLDTWKLSLWLLEMVLLRILNFNGKYSNRLIERRWVGQVESPPWIE